MRNMANMAAFQICFENVSKQNETKKSLNLLQHVGIR